jgi:hypothetical protein
MQACLSAEAIVENGISRPDVYRDFGCLQQCGRGEVKVCKTCLRAVESDHGAKKIMRKENLRKSALILLTMLS